jgi:hypothetical protein
MINDAVNYIKQHFSHSIDFEESILFLIDFIEICFLGKSNDFISKNGEQILNEKDNFCNENCRENVKIWIRNEISISKNNKHTGNFLWAFSKIADSSDKIFLKDILSSYLLTITELSFPLSQAIIAFNNINESPSISSWDATDINQNIKLAQKYINE